VYQCGGMFAMAQDSDDGKQHADDAHQNAHRLTERIGVRAVRCVDFDLCHT